MRPKIICHMISSVDGRLRVERWTPPSAGADPSIVSATYESVAERLQADGWIVGRKSMAPMAKGQPVLSTAPGVNLRTTFIGERRNRSLAIAVDPTGKLHYGKSHMSGEHYVAVLGKNVPDTYLEELRETGV
ncbi:hypothetical protein [Yersinia pseudotuberculosis]|uniref:hypothetical protein n=1 Tax=Yersinia pseudotuberculosis TaxID=633 RepID=UPI001A9F01B8|nr:hypothetical protein [Yersinia pseudotuberculosis]